MTAWRKLRDNGTVFTQTGSSACYTPVCFGGLLSGEYAFVHGIRTNNSPALDLAISTIATTLRQAGYSTNANMTGPLIEALGMTRGFDYYEHRERNLFVYCDWGSPFIARFEQIAGQDSPWFTLLHLFEIHRPRQTNGIPAKRHSDREYDLAWQQLNGWLDELLAKVPDNTIVSLTADHGESIQHRSDRFFGGRLLRKIRHNLRMPRRPDDYRRHGYHVYDELTRIPWAIMGPGIPNGKVIDDQVRQIDICPTLTDLVGNPMESDRNGRSVAPLIHGASMEEEPAYIETGTDDPLRDWHGLRAGGWKYVEHPRHGTNLKPEPMLFNLADDPDEWKNVAGKYPEIAVRMRHKMDEILSRRRSDDEQPGQALTEDQQEKLTEQLKALGYI